VAQKAEKVAKTKTGSAHEAPDYEPAVFQIPGWAAISTPGARRNEREVRGFVRLA